MVRAVASRMTGSSRPCADARRSDEVRRALHVRRGGVSAVGTPTTLSQVVVAASPDDVGAALSGGFDAWKKYRARVLPE